MLDYFIKVLLFQLLFLAVYDFLLKRETFFQWNRMYLLFTSLFAYLIPFLKFYNPQEIVPLTYVVQLPEVLLSPTGTIEQYLEKPALFFNIFHIVFWIGIGISFLLFVLKLYGIFKLISSHEKQFKQKYWLVLLENNNAFSFFKYLFLGQNIPAETQQQIIEHELVHIRQKHSVDLLFFEIQRVVFWFNPFSYLYQQRISELHEFIADAKAIKDKKGYFNNLLAQTFGIQRISLINPFFKHSLIKKRIVMLHKNRSKQILKFKYLLLFPLLAAMLLYTSCENTIDVLEPHGKNEKRVTSLYYGVANSNEIKEIKRKREGYFDVYILATPQGKEIYYEDLSKEEKVEYTELKKLFGKISSGKKMDNMLKIYQNKNGKRSLALTIYLNAIEINKPIDNYKNADVIPFAIIERPPVFPGCENDISPKKCLQEKINEFVSQNFNSSVTKSLGLDAGEKRVYVHFIIDKTGNITNVRARGPHKILEKEAIRVITSLPKMQPGEHNGKKVGFVYTLPIKLQIQ